MVIVTSKETAKKPLPVKKETKKAESKKDSKNKE